jgi:glyoxylase-like metal-dependent hydrolase (beta-lactamase superfamily II)
MELDMSTRIVIGTTTISALDDGTSFLPPMFFPGLEFGSHPGMLSEDGTFHIPTGCFLIQSKGSTVLVDAGMGPANIPFPPDLAAVCGLAEVPVFIAEGGELLKLLAAAGVSPEDIDLVFLTHLHPDHIGWVAPEGQLAFPNAEVVYGAADWEALVVHLPVDDPGRVGLEAASAAGKLRGIEGTTVTVAPGISAHHMPGHTPGHYVLSVTSGDRKVFLIGDTFHHCLQLNDQGISFLTDVDAELALRSREELVARFADTDIAIGMSHFPGLDFTRITVDDERHWVKI